MQKVLVTGGAGFIGSHLCQSLLEKEFEVICIDNLSTGSEKNIEPLLLNPNFKFIKADIVKPIESDLTGVSYIFHLASPASPIDYQDLPEETLSVNSLGTLNILNLAKDLNSKVLIASTSEIYGDPQVHPQDEKYWGNVNTFGPRSCYDESKRFAETAAYVFLHKYDMDIRIVRIFNTYGPKMQKDDGRVVSNFINWALQNKQILIDGDGSQTRSFCFVSDLVDGLNRAMMTNNTKGEIFNLGNPVEFTINDLANKVIELTKSGSEIIHSDNFRTDDPMKRKPDINKAIKVLNWEPQVNLENGLEQTINYYKSI